MGKEGRHQEEKAAQQKSEQNYLIQQELYLCIDNVILERHGKVAIRGSTSAQV